MKMFGLINYKVQQVLSTDAHSVVLGHEMSERRTKKLA